MNYQQLQNGSDIRGVALEGIPGEPVTLTAEAAGTIASSFGRWLAQRAGKAADNLKISVGTDSRLSGPALKGAVIGALRAMGVSVADCGLCSTPAMFMTTVLRGYQFDGAVMITASHLPFNRNGLKFFTPEGGLEKEDISTLLRSCVNALPDGRPMGPLTEIDFLSVYAAYLADKIRRGISDPENSEKPLAGFRICVDAGNGAGGFFVDRVLAPLGADTTGSRFLDPDGLFPNHIPNPENQQAMKAVTQATIENRCDLGIIFDTDVDRAGAVDASGREINRNRLIALMSAIVLEEAPGSTVVTDSVTSSQLKEFIEKTLGGKHHRFKRGYKNVIDEAIRLNREGTECLLAMETSGHGALKENYFLDDGAYLMAKILIQMARLRREGKTVDSLLSSLGEPAEAAEIRMTIAQPDFKAYGQSVIEELAAFAAAQPGWEVAPDNYEGIRVSFGRGKGDGWFLLRMSLHDPLMPLNIESSTPGGVKIIAELLLGWLARFESLNTAQLKAYTEQH